MIICSWQPKSFNQKKTLPVYISFSDSSIANNEMMLNLKVAFANRKVKTISKGECEALSKSETARVLTPFYENAKAMGTQPSFEDMKTYMADRLDIVANHLVIKITVDNEGYIKDTVQWNNGRIPFNFRYPTSTKWNFLKLNQTSLSSILLMSQNVADSIIASGKLYAE